MKENISMVIATLAIVISLIAVATGFIMQPTLSLNTGSVDENELADNSVTGAKVADSTLTNADIEDSSIMLLDLNAEVIAAITGVDIVDNSILSAKIADGTITNDDISDSANIAPGKINGTAWTAANDGSGSGLDADTIDGFQGTQFVRSDVTETRYYAIPTCSFVPEDSDIAYDNVNGAALRNSDPVFEAKSFFAPIQLPHGATITNMAVAYRITDADAQGEVYLFEQGLGSRSILATATLIDLTGSTIIDTVVSETVDNNNQVYYIEAILDPVDEAEDIWLEFVCITYTVTNPLP